MIGIGVATAAAGVVVGAVTLTGLGPVMTAFVEWLAGGSLIAMLLLIAFISLILGMGLPTTANYIVVSSLMAPVVIELGAQHGLVVPLIAVHLYVFYFGIMADITPPVGLAAFAASAISGADPIKTGVQAFGYAMLTAVLPLMFIFNTDIILVGIDSLWHAGLIFAITLMAMCLFAAGVQGYFVFSNTRFESLLLILVAFTLVRPDFWLNKVEEPFEVFSGNQLIEVAAELPENAELRLIVGSEDFEGNWKESVVQLPLAGAGDGEQRVADAGLMLYEDEGRTLVDMVTFGSAAAKAGLDFDQQIVAVQLPNQRMVAEWFYIPAFMLVGLVVLMQRTRRRQTVKGAELA